MGLLRQQVKHFAFQRRFGWCSKYTVLVEHPRERHRTDAQLRSEKRSTRDGVGIVHDWEENAKPGMQND
jgi:hypothetical protein